MACQFGQLKTSLAAISLSLLVFKLVSSVRDTSYTGLTTTCVANYTQTTDDKYQANLQSLLINLTTTRASTSLSFYNTTAGDPGPHKSYGIYLCRGDITSQLCYSCLTNLTRWVRSLDANCTERISYADYCMFRYANYSFFGKADDRSLGSEYDKFDDKISDVYNRTREGAVEKVIWEAAYNSSNLFGTSEAAVDHEQEKVYALAQCTPDIDKDGCNRCLKAAKSYLQEDPEAKFNWAKRASCQLRYDNATFFEVETPASNPAPRPVSTFLVVTLSLFINCLV